MIVGSGPRDCQRGPFGHPHRPIVEHAPTHRNIPDIPHRSVRRHDRPRDSRILTVASLNAPLAISARNNQKCAADGNHVFQKSDWKILPAGSSYQPDASLVAPQSADDTANHTTDKTSYQRLPGSEGRTA